MTRRQFPKSIDQEFRKTQAHPRVEKSSKRALDIVGSLERNGDWLSVLRLDSGFERLLVRFVEVNEGRLVCHDEW